MKNFYVTIMSDEEYDENMDIDEEFNEDPHQKYGFKLEAMSEADAVCKGRKQFTKEYPYNDIEWARAFEIK